ncbi:hypothetical protein NEF87_000656 [Candidatus Lokiarchaeum ossiferum]|uniref:LVIVD repeat protein n=1 Tax=Candidatus Lokiarchaeum ossiferum TaxID=2951803 RepID=A0ABY6HPB3_9ARCH|nr:hypothetical protein NEF87_000656 [Candidatus Lokiarchaeum sp. B-35]
MFKYPISKSKLYLSFVLLVLIFNSYIGLNWFSLGYGATSVSLTQGTKSEAIFIEGNRVYIVDQEKGTEIYDISDPLNISLISQFSRWGNTSKGLFVKEGIGYIADGWGHGVRIINFTDSSYAYQISQIQPKKCFINDVYIQNNTLFIAAGESGLMIYDIADITYPRYLSSFGNEYNSTDGIFIKNNYAFLADGKDGLEIVNISNPSAPEFIGNYSINTESYGITGDNNLIFLADGTKGFKILNVEDTTNISMLGEYKEEFGTLWNVIVQNDVAFLAYGLSGLIAVDLTNSKIPQKLESYYSGGNTVDLAISGKILYLADNWHGLKRLNITNVSHFEKIENSNIIDDQNDQFRAPFWLLGGLGIIVLFGSLYINQTKKRPLPEKL